MISPEKLEASPDHNHMEKAKQLGVDTEVQLRRETVSPKGTPTSQPTQKYSCWQRAGGIQSRTIPTQELDLLIVL